MQPDYSGLDQALARLRPFGTELTNGFTSHAPMVVEALSALGCRHEITPWLDRTASTHLPRPRAGVPVDPDNWSEALGTRQRFADWSAFFERDLADRPWTDVVETWVVRLAPGVCSDATHGIIRTGHAVRALLEAHSQERMLELADALASWADTYQVLPTAPHNGPAYQPEEALSHVPAVPADQRIAGGSIVVDLMQLDGHPAFAPVVNMLDIPDPSRPALTGLLLDLAALFARVAVANVRDFSSAIIFVHSVTALVALWRLSPCLPDAALPDAIRYGWQASAGLYAVYGQYPATAPGDCVPAQIEPLIDRAVASGDDHAIKFAEACHSLHVARPNPAFGAALTAVLRQLAP